MKFVALALTILLAAGSQARFLQADAPAPPSPLEQIRSAGGLYLDEVMKVLQKALEHLDETEYAEYKVKISQCLDDIRARIKTGSETVSPYTDALAVQFMEATKDMREKFTAEVASLRQKINPMGEELKTVVDEHMQEYREKLDPVIREYGKKYMEHVEALKAELEPVVEELRLKLETNLDETKSKLMPILEAVREKVKENLEALKKKAEPYIAEYKDHIITALSNAKDTVSQTGELKTKLQPLTEELKAKLMALWETLTQPKSS